MPTRDQIEAAVLCMEHLCTHDWHGYSQPGRYGDGEGVCAVDTPIGTCYVQQGDRDCSWADIESYEAAGISCGGAYWTGDMVECMTSTGNFRAHRTSDGCNCDDGYVAKRGDAYVAHNGTIQHAAMCTCADPDELAEFVISETGDIDGAVGDQTGYESRIGPFYCAPWDYVLEVVVSESSNPSLDLGNDVKTCEELAREVLAGKWGNGWNRKNALDTAYGNGTYEHVQTIVNEMLGLEGC